jgi:hypothetical protein
MTQDEFLSSVRRDVIAAELVRMHTAAMNVPAHFVIQFFRPTREIPPTSLQITRPSALFWGSSAAGHTSEEKTRPVQALWKMIQDNTGISDRDLSVALQEVPPSQTMENGGIMPDVQSRVSRLDAT